MERVRDHEVRTTRASNEIEKLKAIKEGKKKDNKMNIHVRVIKDQDIRQMNTITKEQKA